MDKDGSLFMRLESDGPPGFDGPFILAVNVAKYVDICLGEMIILVKLKIRIHKFCFKVLCVRALGG